MEPLASSWGVHARGLTHLDVTSDPEREGLAIFLIGEALRLAALDGVTWLRHRSPRWTSRSRLILVGKLGFQVVEQALELRKEVDRPATPIASRLTGTA